MIIETIYSIQIGTRKLPEASGDTGDGGYDVVVNVLRDGDKKGRRKPRFVGFKFSQSPREGVVVRIGLARSAT